VTEVYDSNERYAKRDFVLMALNADASLNLFHQSCPTRIVHLLGVQRRALQKCRPISSGPAGRKCAANRGRALSCSRWINAFGPYRQ
jgi:hypothetical protein